MDSLTVVDPLLLGGEGEGGGGGAASDVVLITLSS